MIGSMTGFNETLLKKGEIASSLIRLLNEFADRRKKG